MTEEEAKKKWCPFVRISDGENLNEPITSRLIPLEDHGSGETNCIGSACMAWRWEERKTVPAEGYQTPEGQSVVTRYMTIDPQEGAGFCGLAAKP